MGREFDVFPVEDIKNRRAFWMEEEGEAAGWQVGITSTWQQHQWVIQKDGNCLAYLRIITSHFILILEKFL